MSSLNHGLRNRVRGFGLIELMIAMVLGLLVIGAAFAVFQSNQATYRANEGVNRIQENARVAFELISRDLRAAGGSACSSASVVETTSTESDYFKSNPIYGNGSTLTVTSGDDTAYRVTASSDTSVTLDLTGTGLATATDAFKVNDWILLCNARKTFIVQASAVGTNKIDFVALPGNYKPNDDEFAPPAAVTVAKLRRTTWSLDGSTLRVSRFGAAGEAVAEGVQNFAVSYLQRGATAYANAPGSDVIAVRVNMTLTGQDVDGRALTRNVSNVVSLRSRTL